MGSWENDRAFPMNEGPFTQLPDNLPIPEDDGGADHLAGRRLPDMALPSSSGESINLRERRGRVVLYAYPLTGWPGVPLPAGWDEIPGARGCTPESCAFRDVGAEVWGLSTQSGDYQREVRERLHLPFDLLSNEAFAFADALSLPTFLVDSRRLLQAADAHLPRGRDRARLLSRLSARQASGRVACLAHAQRLTPCGSCPAAMGIILKIRACQARRGVYFPLLFARNWRLRVESPG